MIFPARKPPFIYGNFHGYVSHNQMVTLHVIHRKSQQNHHPTRPSRAVVSVAEAAEGLGGISIKASRAWCYRRA